jgi:hypothetical protein
MNLIVSPTLGSLEARTTKSKVFIQFDTTSDAYISIDFRMSLLWGCKDKPHLFKIYSALAQVAAMLERLGTLTASSGPPVSHKSASCGGRGIRGRKEGGAELWRRILSQFYCTLSRPTSENPTGTISQSVQPVHRTAVDAMGAT